MKCTLIRAFVSALCALSVVLIGACDKASAPPEPFNPEVAAQHWNSAQKTWSETELSLLEGGRSLYRGRCAVCHLLSGEGQQTFGAPALKGSAIVKGDSDGLIRMVLHGRNSMPAFGRSVNDADLAAVLSYVRNAWDNTTADVITPAAVAAVRQPASP